MPRKSLNAYAAASYMEKTRPGSTFLSQFSDPAAPAFAAWMTQVDALIARAAAGLISADLPDAPYRDWFDARWSPIRAARRALDLAE